jgi:hypothetical protein
MSIVECTLTNFAVASAKTNKNALAQKFVKVRANHRNWHALVALAIPKPLTA